MQKQFLLLIVWYSKSFSDLYESFALFFNDSSLLLVIISIIFCNLEFFWYSSYKHLLNFSDNFIIVVVYFMFLYKASTWRALNDSILSENASLRNQNRVSDIKYILLSLWEICRLKNWIYWKICIKYRLNLFVHNIKNNVYLTIFKIAE